MKSFIDLANEAEVLLNKELDSIAKVKKQLEKKTAELDLREESLNTQANNNEKRSASLNEREVEISQRETKVRRDSEVAAEMQAAGLARLDAEKSLAKAKTLNDDTTQKLEMLTTREVALSEREKTYKETVKKELMNGLFKSL